MKDTRKGYLLSKIVYVRVRDWTSGRSLSEQSFTEQPPTPLPPTSPQGFWQVLVFRATFFVSSNFLHNFGAISLTIFFSNSEISEQLLVLKLALLPYCTVFQQTIYEFPMKKEPDPHPLGADDGRKMQPGCQVRGFFEQKGKMADVDSPLTDTSF